MFTDREDLLLFCAKYFLWSNLEFYGTVFKDNVILKRKENEQNIRKLKEKR